MLGESLPGAAGSPDTAAMILNDFFYNRKPDSAAALGRIAGTVRPEETVIDSRQILLVNPSPVVTDITLDKISVIRQDHTDLPGLFIQIFHAVRDDVADHLIELLRIGNHPDFLGNPLFIGKLNTFSG